MEKLLQETAHRAAAYLKVNRDRPVAPSPEAVHALAALEEALWRAIAPRVVAYRGEAGQAADLEAIKNYYLKKRYLLRIRENLNKFAAR